MACGADVVIQSLHKTMPALTQTALIHINGRLVDRERLRKMLVTYQTSSPSYVLMASISQCMSWLGQEGAERFACYSQEVWKFRRRLKDMKHLYLYTSEGIFDWGKLVICTDRSDQTGRKLYDRLRKSFDLQMEMASARYVLAMSTVGDSSEGLQRLAQALEVIDSEAAQNDSPVQRSVADKTGISLLTPERYMEIDAAAEQPTEEVALADANGRVIGDYLYLYPPGVPILVPGEVIQMKHIENIQNYLSQGLEVHGGYLKENGNVKVILHHG